MQKIHQCEYYLLTKYDPELKQFTFQFAGFLSIGQRSRSNC